MLVSSFFNECVINMWNSLLVSVDFRLLAIFIHTVTDVEVGNCLSVSFRLFGLLRCFGNMFFSVLGQMLEHFAFCPVQLHCILSFN